MSNQDVLIDGQWVDVDLVRDRPELWVEVQTGDDSDGNPTYGRGLRPDLETRSRRVMRKATRLALGLPYRPGGYPEGWAPGMPWPTELGWGPAPTAAELTLSYDKSPGSNRGGGSYDYGPGGNAYQPGTPAYEERMRQLAGSTPPVPTGLPATVTQDTGFTDFSSTGQGQVGSFDMSPDVTPTGLPTITPPVVTPVAPGPTTQQADPFAAFKAKYRQLLGRDITAAELANPKSLAQLSGELQMLLPDEALAFLPIPALLTLPNEGLMRAARYNPNLLGHIPPERWATFPRDYVDNEALPWLQAADADKAAAVTRALNPTGLPPGVDGQPIGPAVTTTPPPGVTTTTTPPAIQTQFAPLPRIGSPQYSGSRNPLDVYMETVYGSGWKSQGAAATSAIPSGLPNVAQGATQEDADLSNGRIFLSQSGLPAGGPSAMMRNPQDAQGKALTQEQVDRLAGGGDGTEGYDNINYLSNTQDIPGGLPAGDRPGLDEKDEPPMPTTSPGIGRQWIPSYDDYGNFKGWKSEADPSYVNPNSNQETPAERAAREARLAGNAAADDARAKERLEMDRELQPHKIRQILAGLGLSAAELARLEALLPGELLQQGATLAQTYAAIENARERLGLDKDKFKWEQAMDEAGLTGTYQGAPTMARLKLALDAELSYANSRRSDVATNVSVANTTGYYNGLPTLEREKLISDAERADLLARAEVGDKAAQIRLKEIDQAETALNNERNFGLNQGGLTGTYEGQETLAARTAREAAALAQGRLGLDTELGRGRLALDTLTQEQRNALERGQLDLATLTQEQRNAIEQGRLGLDTELGRGQLELGQGRLGLDTELGRGDLALRQQAEQRAWRANPASFLDQVWGARGNTPSGLPTTGQAQASGLPNTRPWYQGAVNSDGRAVPEGYVQFQNNEWGPPPRPLGPGEMNSGGTTRNGATGGPPAPLTYDEIHGSGLLQGAGISDLVEGNQARSYRPLSGLPLVSAQTARRMSPLQGQAFNEVVKATGNNPDDYWDQVDKLSAQGSPARRAQAVPAGLPTRRAQRYGR